MFYNIFPVVREEGVYPIRSFWRLWPIMAYCLGLPHGWRCVCESNHFPRRFWKNVVNNGVVSKWGVDPRSKVFSCAEEWVLIWHGVSSRMKLPSCVVFSSFLQESFLRFGGSFRGKIAEMWEIPGFVYWKVRYDTKKSDFQHGYTDKIVEPDWISGKVPCFLMGSKQV